MAKMGYFRTPQHQVVDNDPFTKKASRGATNEAFERGRAMKDQKKGRNQTIIATGKRLK